MAEYKVQEPIYINAVNIYENWYEEDPIYNRQTFMPVVILHPDDDPAVLSVPPNTVILRIVEI